MSALFRRADARTWSISSIRRRPSAESGLRCGRPHGSGELDELRTKIAREVKTLGGDLSFGTASTAIQVLGGAGYTQDWPVEQILRDARVLPIFEGTTGMQAIDLLHRRLWKGEGRGLALFLARFEAEIAGLEPIDSGSAATATAILVALKKVGDRLRQWAEEPREAEAGATSFLALATDAAPAWTAVRLLRLRGDDPVAARLKALARAALPRLAGQAACHAAEAQAGSAAVMAITTL